MSAPGKSRSGRSTPRSTAGVGYDFEDLVAAWLLAKMLRGEPAPGLDRGAELLQFQTEALGWSIDDLLVTAAGGGDRRLAISCKSSRQVTAASLPADFVERAWAQWRQAGVGPMVRASDRLALFFRARSGTLPFQEAWSEIVDWASGDDALALARIRRTAKHAALFDSIRRPGGNDLGGSDVETLHLLRRLEVVELDFQLTQSSKLDDGVRRCREILVSDDWEDARRLWRELVGLARGARLSGGALGLDRVWAHLRPMFDLKGRPDVAPSWTVLAALTEEYRAGVLLTLPTGLAFERTELIAQLGARDALPVMVIHGDSGAGKSAIVKAALAASEAAQVWLGPEQVKLALNEAERQKVGLRQPLLRVLEAAPTRSNVLVLDSVEKLDGATRLKAKDLLTALVNRPEGGPAVWRVIIIAQSDALGDILSTMSGQPFQPVVVGPLAPADVRHALRNTPQLGWLADDGAAVQALSNLKTLGWVIQASAEFSGDAAQLSPPAIADRVWRYWTQGNLASQQLLMTLAEREGRFERSFALTDLEPAQATIFQSGSANVPLALNKRNRLQFEHDLAADWTRFQWLKQVAEAPAVLADLAGNPLWHSALRILGQMLLREGDIGATAWDRVFGVLAQDGGSVAADLLLDALYLDPEAGRFLAERADFLLDNKGAWLERLLKRFLHTGTAPNGAFGGLALDASMDIHLEAAFRTPIVSRWGAIVRFLHANITRVCRLASPAVARACEVWLVGTPSVAPAGCIIVHRRELAEIALACVRELQVREGAAVFYRRDGSHPLYAAALAAAPDLPAEIGAWALEMAERRTVATDVSQRIANARRAEAEEQAKRDLAAPPRPGRARPPIPTFISTVEELPAWPLGPAEKVDHKFRVAVLNGTTIRPLIQADAAVAAEVVLACIINGAPTRDRSSPMFGGDLGLEHDDSGYPTAYWKGPFLPFLQINPSQALTALIALVDFCTERWVESVRMKGYTPGPELVIRLADGVERRYLGGGATLHWAHHNDLGTGQLFCALSALEKWLTLQIDAGEDVGPHLGRILSESTSCALLGVVLNVVKYQPSLLKGALMPLVGSQALYNLTLSDTHEPEFPGWKWAASGEVAFELAKQWAFSPYREKSWLHDVIVPLIAQDAALASFAKESIKLWIRPDGRKAALEFDLLTAQLAADNYSLVRDPSTGAEAPLFTCPANLAEQVAAYQAERAVAMQELLFPIRCERALREGVVLEAGEASALAEILKSGGTIKADNGEDGPSYSTLIAATLAVCAADWLLGQSEVGRRVLEVLRQAPGGVANDYEAIQSVSIGGGDPAWKVAAHAIFTMWADRGSSGGGNWDVPLLRLLTSGDAASVGTIMQRAYEKRGELGGRWWRLLQVGTMWSALLALSPGYGDPPGVAHRWSRWLDRLRRLPLAECDEVPVLDLDSLRARVGRLVGARRARAYAARENALERDPSGRPDPALGEGFLGELFDWLLNIDAAIAGRDLTVERALTLMLWDYERRWCSDHRGDDGEYPLSHSLGYKVVEKLAWISAHDPAADADRAWREVLAMGPDGHHLVQHFVRSWFVVATRIADAGLFARRWRAMIEYALDAGWRKKPRWYYGDQIFRQLLGLAFAETLGRAKGAAGAILGMRDLYQRWATAHLGDDEDNFASFAHFLSTEAGRPLRPAAIGWIADALALRTSPVRWSRDNAGDCMITLLDVTIAADGSALVSDNATRDAVLYLAADLASQHVAAAMALQERIKRLGT